MPADAGVPAGEFLDPVVLERVIIDGVLSFGDRQLVSSVRPVVVGCLECWKHAIERGEEWAGEPPAAVKIHARQAARAGIALIKLLDCYRRSRDLTWRAIMAGLAEREREEGHAVARLVWAAGESLLDRVLQAARIAYEDEIALEGQTHGQRQARLVWRLLSGDRTVDPNAIGYDFNVRHLGLAASGPDARRAQQMLSDRCGASLFALPEREGILAGWLRLGRELRPAEVQRWLPAHHYPGLALAIGRCADGLDGFCHTHRLAMEALRVARRRRMHVAWHADVELDALLLRNPAFARELVANYIAPLDEVLLRTLRVCHAQAWNESAAARDLGANRSTITRRLERIEQIIERPINIRRFNIELALRAIELGMRTETDKDELSSQQPAAN